MFPGINPKKMQKMMQQMGMKQEEIDAKEVIVKCEGKDLIVRNPQVAKVDFMGQEMLQVTGSLEELEGVKEEDIKTVADQAKVSEGKARKALEENNGDLATAIMSLKKD